MEDFRYMQNLLLSGAISDQLWAERGKKALHAAVEKSVNESRS